MRSDDGVIVWSCDGTLAQINIQRPDKHNALAGCHWAMLGKALDAIAGSSACVVVVSGVPGAFSAGADIDELGQLLATPQAFAASNAEVQCTQLKLQRLPQTTVAVIDGICVGGGLGLALACDLRLSSPRSRFAITPAKLGLVYSVDDSRRLVAAVGMARAREMLLTGRMLDAGTALEWGLIHQLDADLEVLRLACISQLLATSSQARAGIKSVLGHLGGDVHFSLEQAETAFHCAFSSRDFAEGAAAFLEKRAPDFV